MPDRQNQEKDEFRNIRVYAFLDLKKEIIFRTAKTLGLSGIEAWPYGNLFEQF